MFEEEMSKRMKRIPLLLMMSLAQACAHGSSQNASSPPAPSATASPSPAAAVPSSPAATPNPTETPKPVSPAKGTDLFNGTDLSGWEYVAGTSGDITQVASIKAGVVTTVGKPNGYIVSRSSYADYLLHVEWRWTDLVSNPATNGGVLVNISSGPVQQNLWPTSFQVQLKVQRAGDVLGMGQSRCTELPPPAPIPNSPSATLLRREPSNEVALGEWNTADITMRGGSIEVKVNGVVQNRASGCTPSSGRIGFQLEGYPFELRNVRIDKLKVKPPNF
jgi:hypothetical protein